MTNNEVILPSSKAVVAASANSLVVVRLPAAKFDRPL
ncbi:MAG: hypothetical protein QOE04_2771 [Mycobacterium sp.]|jgi:hypothetical protein|nr:hypothetical protein [Mycobacterium sp.]